MDHLILQSVLALVAGIAVLVWPKILNYVVGAYLIVIGATGLLTVYA